MMPEVYLGGWMIYSSLEHKAQYNVGSGVAQRRTSEIPIEARKKASFVGMGN